MFFSSKSPHEAYKNRLQQAELDNTILAKSWMAAADKSLADPLEVELPYSEKGFFAPEAPRAGGFIFNAKKGQQINVRITTQPDTQNIFAELFLVESGGKRSMRAYADSAGVISYDVEENEQLVLRIQAELLAAVSYTLEVIAGPSMGFPVSGGTNKDIGSTWGDPRDGGARRHEGVDIFGKRGTPVVAAADGRVSSVKEGGLGGKNVWMKPSGRSISLYYAHLDSQMVSIGQSVAAGDTLGLMGNTGNARTTAPHLHFGIYGIGGAMDPLPFIKIASQQPATIRGKDEHPGTAMRASGTLQYSTISKKEQRKLDNNTYVTVVAASRDYYKVELPDGTSGFVRTGSVSPLSRTLKNISAGSQAQLSYAPMENSAVVTTANEPRLPVKAYYSGYAYVDTDSMRGWVRMINK